MGALPDELDRLGCDVTVFTPLYSAVDRKAFGIKPHPDVPALETFVTGKPEKFKLHSTVKKGTGVKVFFIENDRFYSREGIYTVPETGKAFKDEDERTVFFNRAVIEAVKACDLHPDIIHCNDFHAGLIPAYIELEERGDAHFENTGTVFSVHNLAYQGSFRKNVLKKAGFDASLFKPMSPFEFWGKVNVMKIGLSFAGIVSTVSGTYADEISSSEEFGYGLEGVLRSRKEDLVGILNGIDQESWNPSTDSLIPARYNADDLSGKEKNRKELLGAFGLPRKAGVPVVGMISRLVDQKGFDILADAFATLMKLDLRLVILGTGQEKYHKIYGKLAARYKKRFGLKLEFNNKLAHLIEAGSDFFLMPSRYEPCGLNQMYSLRYGTIPIVRATGGLRDTVRQLTRTGSRGNGFTFDAYDPVELADAVDRAARFYADNAAVERARKRIMKEDHSWRRSAGEYMKVYDRARGRARIGLTH